VASVSFQANTVKGFRFWDEAGLIANKYVDRFRAINYGNIPQTLVCAAPSDPGDYMMELRVSPYNIWIAYRAMVSWVTVRQETSRDVAWIARAIDVTQFSRLGLRVSLLWHGQDREHVVNTLLSQALNVHEQDWAQVGRATGGELVVHLEHDKLAVRLWMSPVVNVRREQHVTIPGSEPPPHMEEEILPDFAISVDADLADTRITESVDVMPHLNRSVKYLQESLIPFISRMLEQEH